MNLLEQYNKKHQDNFLVGRSLPDFRAGDTLKVSIKITEGATERIQIFEGVCIARKNRSMGSTFVVRKLSNNIGVEKVFHLYSPSTEKIEVIKRGKVRRAKIYYIRGLRGKAARITERKRDIKPKIILA